jgi:hypothetical protein
MVGKVGSIGKQDEQSLARGPGQGESKGDEGAERHFRIPLTPLPRKGGKGGMIYCPRLPIAGRRKEAVKEGPYLANPSLAARARIVS